MGKTRFTFWYFVLPGLSIYAVFFLLPIVQALWYSFYHWPGFGSGKFIGLENYITLMSDSILMISLTNSLIFMLHLITLITIVTIASALIILYVYNPHR